MSDVKQTAPLTPGAVDLVAKLVQSNYDSYAAVSQQLIDGLTEENAKLRAELALIRADICLVLSGVFMPTGGHLLGLLWPSQEEILQHIEREKGMAS